MVVLWYYVSMFCGTTVVLKCDVSMYCGTMWYCGTVVFDVLILVMYWSVTLYIVSNGPVYWCVFPGPMSEAYPVNRCFNML